MLAVHSRTSISRLGRVSPFVFRSATFSIRPYLPPRLCQLFVYYLVVYNDTSIQAGAIKFNHGMYTN